jgi:hypothetical protein
MDGSEKFRVQGAGVVREGMALGLPMNAFALYVAAWVGLHSLRVSGWLYGPYPRMSK